MKSIILPKGTTYVRFDELAELLARAMNPDAEQDGDNLDAALSTIQLESDLPRAVQSGDLRVCNPLSHLPLTLSSGNSLKRGVVMIHDLREFAARLGLSVEFEETPCKAPAPKPTAASVPAGPEPLTTGDIASSFEELPWSETEWKKPLGDLREWLKPCLVIPGNRGGPARRWNPVFIGAALVRKKGVPLRQVRGRFQSRPALKPWLEAWKTYEADNFGDV